MSVRLVHEKRPKAAEIRQPSDANRCNHRRGRSNDFAPAKRASIAAQSISFWRTMKKLREDGLHTIGSRPNENHGDRDDNTAEAWLSKFTYTPK